MLRKVRIVFVLKASFIFKCVGAASASVNDGEWRRREERGATAGSGVKGVRLNAEPWGRLLLGAVVA